MRPKDENGLSLKSPSLRLGDRATMLRQAAILAMAKDPRSCCLTTERKVRIANKVINHVIDGDVIPKFVFAKDKDRPGNNFMFDLWRLAEDAVRSEHKATAGR